jgi:hypothetical protein
VAANVSALRAIKIAHTLAWAFFAGYILLPLTAVAGRYNKHMFGTLFQWRTA